MNKEESKGKNHKFLFLYELYELKKVFLNQDEEENSNAERIIRKNDNGIK